METITQDGYLDCITRERRTANRHFMISCVSVRWLLNCKWIKNLDVEFRVRVALIFRDASSLSVWELP